jgi:ABC-2 type transport system permease protein
MNARTMSLGAIAKKEFKDSIRSYSLLTLIGVFTLFAGGLALIQHVPPTYLTGEYDTSTLALLNSMRQPTVFFVPMIGLAVGYGAIANERQSGSLRLLLSLPNSRADIVFGKFIGQTLVVLVSIGIGYAVAGTIALTTYETFDIRIFGLYTGLTALYGTIYIALAIGLSSILESKEKALVGASAAYLLFIIGWDILLLFLQLAIYGPQAPEGGLPDWFKFIGLANPSTSFMYAVRTVIPAYSELTFYPDSTAVYMQEWVGFPLLLLWGLVPLGVGYYRFRTAHLS